MPTLYVMETGARVEKEYTSLLVTDQEGEALLSVPISQVSEVVLVSSAGVTTPAMWALLERKIPLTLVNRTGRMVGRLSSGRDLHLDLRRQQYLRSQDPAFCLEISRLIVTAKLKNSRTMLRRILRQEQNQPTADLQAAGQGALAANRRALTRIPEAADLSSLRGLEGQASRAYFAVLRRALHPDLSFERRSRRPPADPANALLSLAYSFLTNACFTACSLAGLDPYDGFYHADRYGRPALALDLLEEYRAIVADSVVLTLVNNQVLQPDDFETSWVKGRQAVFLTRHGMREFITAFESRLQKAARHPLADRALSMQKILEVQARQLRKCIEQGDPSYQPYLPK